MENGAKIGMSQHAVQPIPKECEELFRGFGLPQNLRMTWRFNRDTRYPPLKHCGRSLHTILYLEKSHDQSPYFELLQWL
jgi:hypothetical protein